MVDAKEIKCYEYICSIQDIESLGCVGLYGLDKFREEIHNELCKLFGLEKIETKKFTKRAPYRVLERNEEESPGFIRGDISRSIPERSGVEGVHLHLFVNRHSGIISSRILENKC